MKLLEQRILTEGKVLSGDVLKIDSFLNQQIDVKLLDEIGKELTRLFKDENVTKVLTAESSGIAIACFAALHLGCPAVFARKSKSSNISDNLWTAKAHSYTHGNDYTMIVSKDYIGPEDRVLIVDDFLANGSALTALVSLCRQAGAFVVGAGIAVEKAYQGGSKLPEFEGIRIESMARIASMDPEKGIIFE